METITVLELLTKHSDTKWDNIFVNGEQHTWHDVEALCKGMNPKQQVRTMILETIIGKKQNILTISI